MPDTKVHVEVDGQIDTLERYVLVQNENGGASILLNGDIYFLGKAMMLTYNAFLQECTKYSDQDLYEVCKVLDLNYKLTRNMVQEWRKHG